MVELLRYERSGGDGGGRLTEDGSDRDRRVLSRDYALDSSLRRPVLEPPTAPGDAVSRSSQKLRNEDARGECSDLCRPLSIARLDHSHVSLVGELGILDHRSDEEAVAVLLDAHVVEVDELPRSEIGIPGRLSLLVEERDLKLALTSDLGGSVGLLGFVDEAVFVLGVVRDVKLDGAAVLVRPDDLEDERGQSAIGR